MDEIETTLRNALKNPEFRKRAEADPEVAVRSLIEKGELSDDDLDAVAGGMMQLQQLLQMNHDTEMP